MNKRPTYTDPDEWALIREMYFEGATFRNADIDPIEALDRMEHTRTTNQAR